MFELVKGTQAASLYIAKEADDFAGLSHVAEKIQKDIELVTGVAPKICDAMPEGYSIIPGTIGKNPVIDEMIANGKLNVSQLDGKRESYALCLVDGDKLVIAGTETVATLHGMYHISEKMVCRHGCTGEMLFRANRQKLFGMRASNLPQKSLRLNSVDSL